MLNYFTLNNLRELIQQLLDIACVWALVYYCLKIVKNNSRTIQIFVVFWRKSVKPMCFPVFPR